MSASPTMRRAERLMSEADTLQMLEKGFCGRIAVMGEDGYPYCVPLLYIWQGEEIWLHTARAQGHLRRSTEAQQRVCFEIDEPEQVYPYGRFECDTGLGYRSVIVFGQIRVVEDANSKQQFFAALMQKYGNPEWPERPRNFFPRLDQISLYAIAVDRMTGKHSPLPEVSRQWPALDRTATPNAKP
jgi:nitroimidazol reductase NimA-like FMN-containing flavoprotein (pyridoxamine 5'-phosphate oxidase superfamily)